MIKVKVTELRSVFGQPLLKIDYISIFKAKLKNKADNSFSLYSLKHKVKKYKFSF